MVLPTHIGPYRIVRLLGQGGMGRVYEARTPERDEPIALKCVRHAMSRSQHAALTREASLLSSLDHPHVVRLIDIGQQNSVPPELYLALELVSGGDLATHPPASPADAFEVLRQTLLALSHAHAAGVLHLDLSLRNLLRRREDTSRPHVMLTDFGLSAQLSDRAQPLGGTRSFSAPEQLRGERALYGPWTDLYAVGRLAEIWLPASPEIDQWRQWLLAPSHLRRPTNARDALDALDTLGPIIRRSSVMPVQTASPLPDESTVPVLVASSSPPSGAPSPPAVASRPARTLPIEVPSPPRTRFSRRGLRHALLTYPPLTGRTAELATAYRLISQQLADRTVARLAIVGAQGAGTSAVARALSAQLADALGAQVLDGDTGADDAPLTRLLSQWCGHSASLSSIETRLGTGSADSPLPSQLHAYLASVPTDTSAEAPGRTEPLSAERIALAWWTALAQRQALVIRLGPQRTNTMLHSAAVRLARLRTKHPVVVIHIPGPETPSPACDEVRISRMGAAALRRVAHATMDLDDSWVSALLRDADGFPGRLVHRLMSLGAAGLLTPGPDGYRLDRPAPAMADYWRRRLGGDPHLNDAVLVDTATAICSGTPLNDDVPGQLGRFAGRTLDRPEVRQAVLELADERGVGQTARRKALTMLTGTDAHTQERRGRLLAAIGDIASSRKCLLAAADTRLTSGAPSHALALYVEAGDPVHPTGLWLRAKTHHALGHTQQADEAATATLEAMGPEDQRLSHVHALLVMLALSRGDRTLAARRLAAAHTWTASHGDATAECRLAIVQGRFEVITGRSEEAVRSLERALHSVRLLPDSRESTTLQRDAWCYASHAYALARDLAPLELLTAEALADHRCNDRVAVQMLMALSDEQRHCGRLDDAAETCERALRRALPGSPLTAYTLGNLALARALQGRFAESEAAAIEGLSQIPENETTRARAYLVAMRLPALAHRAEWQLYARCQDEVHAFVQQGITLEEMAVALDLVEPVLADAPARVRSVFEDLRTRL